MNLQEIQTKDATYYLNTFGQRTPVAFERGSGMTLYDTQGQEYLDLFAGIAVSALGHSHPAFVEALKSQAEKLLHVSNLYYNPPQTALAQKLAEISHMDRVFFCNSGAEANEGALKLAKMYFYKKGMPHKNQIITLRDSFHGRTLATVAATGQEKYQKPYRPLTPGFIHVPLNDEEALTNAVNENTCAMMLEFIQGESGVHPISEAFIKTVRQLCEKHDILLIADEVQTGIGRTGKLFACEHFGVKPDIMTLAKALGGGVPIGAILASGEAADAFQPGDHGTTFGGNPFCTNAALAVLNIIEQERLVENSAAMGEYFHAALTELQKKHTIIGEIRGKGLMIGIGLIKPIAKEVNQKLFARHILAGSVGDDSLRLLPPLIIQKQHIDTFIRALDAVLSEL